MVRYPRASSKKTRIETRENLLLLVKQLRIRGQVPRKQGLKPDQIYRKFKGALYPRASSKKTRIETWCLLEYLLSTRKSEGKFQENKDWNLRMGCSVINCGKSEGKFQENKDWNQERAQADYRASESEGKFQENKDWNSISQRHKTATRSSEGKFQENKDWNLWYRRDHCFANRNPRASSKKTRIETMVTPIAARNSGRIRGQVPRKQGLKLIKLLCLLWK